MAHSFNTIYRPVDPPRPVEVLERGSWLPGRLTYWVRNDDGWRGYVHWTDDGYPRACFFWAENVRPTRPSCGPSNA